MSKIGENTSRRFSMDDIRKATDNFKSKILGEGSFGKVYKGVIDDESTQTVVAVKQCLVPDSKLGIQSLETEVRMLSKCRHSNLVNLLGYCSENQEMILVYEYMSGGNLTDLLYDNGSSLTWEQRLKICIGVARGLEYLHTGTGLSEKIVHLDIKSDNILLDGNLAAKVADLGLARIAPANKPTSQVHTAGTRGTAGYLDPEYSRTNRYSSKSDVYSCGVVLLEVLNGKAIWMDPQTIPTSDLANWIQQQIITKKTLESIVDPNIASQIQPRSLNCFLNTARNMLQLDPVKRPTMSSVIAQLESALQFQSSSAAVDKDDPFEGGFEGQTSRSNYEPELSANAPNVFGEPIGDKQTVLMGFDPTHANRALAAYGRAFDDVYCTKVKDFLHNLEANNGSGIKTLCIIYNATGETLTYVTSRNFYGDTIPYSYPAKIHNGQFGAFMHMQTPMSTGSVGAVVYRGKYKDNASCDHMVTWSNISGYNCAAYCEINESGHFDVADWNTIFMTRLNFAGPKKTVTWNECLTVVNIEREMTSTVFEAVFTQVGIHERYCQMINGQPQA